MQQLTTRSLLPVCIAGMLGLAGCATGRVTFVRVDAPKGAISRADVVVVKGFDTSRTPAFGDGHESDEVVHVHRDRFRDAIAMRLVQHLEARGFQAIRQSELGRRGDS